MAIVNQRQLIIQLSTAKPQLVKYADKLLRDTLYNPAVESMREEFKNHPVTREIEEGIEAKNDSGTLVGGESTEGKNLYSFIGFDEGDEPIKKIEPFFEDGAKGGPKLEYVRGSQQNNLSFDFKLTIPDKNAIFDATPLPWANGISWAQRIEVGLAGFGYFLNKLGLRNSRSGGGIQVPNKLRPGGFRNVKYISEIINNFRAKFKNTT